MTTSDERREMMFAQRRDADVFHDHHLVVLVAGQRNHVLLGILAHTGSQFRIHLRDALRRLLQTGTFRILADPFENQAHAFGYQFKIYVIRVHLWFIALRTASSTALTGT